MASVVRRWFWARCLNSSNWLAFNLTAFNVTFMWTERRLPRLDKSYYLGPAYVFWTHVVKDRATGWLDEAFHAHFREVLLHAMSRYQIACPTYVLMPDHIHLIWIGSQQSSNQLLANRLLRTHLQLPLQKQAYDHVIQQDERTGSLFADTCNYVRNNPVRANLAETIEEWSFQGTMVPGYPSLYHVDSSVFWKCFHAYQRVGQS